MGLNIDNAPIQGIPAATTTSELRSWLLNRNLPNVITDFYKIVLLPTHISKPDFIMMVE